MKYFFVVVFSLFSPSISAHSGGTIKSGPHKGCHTNSRTNEFHCHNGQGTNYTRDLFGGWSDEDHNCKDTRAEILIKRSELPVILNKKGCTVISGRWKDFYFNEILLKASDIDIDHVVPVKHAYDIGAKNWDKKKRVAFYNDPENLVITNLKYNRQKGARTPGQWLPLQKNYACKYLNQWLLVKSKYELPIEDHILKQKEEVCKVPRT